MLHDNQMMEIKYRIYPEITCISAEPLLESKSIFYDKLKIHFEKSDQNGFFATDLVFVL